jgi:hypothetical protein
MPSADLRLAGPLQDNSSGTYRLSPVMSTMCTCYINILLIYLTIDEHVWGDGASRRLRENPARVPTFIYPEIDRLREARSNQSILSLKTCQPGRTCPSLRLDIPPQGSQAIQPQSSQGVQNVRIVCTMATWLQRENRLEWSPARYVGLRRRLMGEQTLNLHESKPRAR